MNTSARLSDLPDNATVDQGRVTLTLATPVSLPHPGRPRVIRELVFRRLGGVVMLQSNRSPHLLLSKSLGISLVEMSALERAVSDDDWRRILNVLRWLTGATEDVSGRLQPGPDGGFVFGLRYPVSDGAVAHSSFLFRSFSVPQLQACPRSPDRFVPFALHLTTGLPLRTTRRLADMMDAADFIVAEKALSALGQRAVDAARTPRAVGRI